VTDHDFRADKVDETDESFRYRQFSPTLCREGSERTIELTKGVKAVICRKKETKKSRGRGLTISDRLLLKKVFAALGESSNRAANSSGEGRDPDKIVISKGELSSMRRQILIGIKNYEEVLGKLKRYLEDSKEDA